MENPIKMDDLGGKNPYLWVNTHTIPMGSFIEMGFAPGQPLRCNENCNWNHIVRCVSWRIFEKTNYHGPPKRIHGTGIFTHMNGWFFMVNVYHGPPKRVLLKGINESQPFDA